MSDLEGSTTLLLIEDNDAEAMLVTEMLSEGTNDCYHVVHVTRLAEELGKIAAAKFDQSGAIASRMPERFDAMVTDYFGLLTTLMMSNGQRADVFRTEMAKIITVLGDPRGGPRDLLDLHVAALDRAASDRSVHGPDRWSLLRPA